MNLMRLSAISTKIFWEKGTIKMESLNPVISVMRQSQKYPMKNLLY